MKQINLLLVPIGIFLIAFTFRFKGLLDNHPFWVDEFSSANQAQLLLKYGLSFLTNPDINREYNNIISHLLIAGAFRFLGQHEWTARLPFVLIGSLVPVAVYITGRLIFKEPVALGAALLTIFSYFEITWSRQARGYVLLQLVILASTYIYYQIVIQGERSKQLLLCGGVLIVIGILTHSAFWLLIMAMIVHASLVRRSDIMRALRRPLTYISLVIVLSIAFKMHIIESLIAYVQSGIFTVNNIWYYHSFLWRQYGLISFLAVLGIVIGMFKKLTIISFLALYIGLNLLFFNFVFAPYVTRYMLPIFPLLFLFSVYTLSLLAESIVISKKKHISHFLTIAAVLFIVINGYKFDIKPNRFYSVNHDFQEIALIDYHQIYRHIKERGDIKKGQTAVIDTWSDRLYWYLGTDYYAPYVFRWANEHGTTNGLRRVTSFVYNTQGEKIIPRQKNLRFISELSYLKQAMKKYPKGFIFIDDATMPRDVIAYAENNFHKELYLDHYPLDDNPYSLWPATLYSWGIEKNSSAP